MKIYSFKDDNVNKEQGQIANLRSTSTYIKDSHGIFIILLLVSLGKGHRDSGEDFLKLSFLRAFSLCRQYLPCEKGVVLHLTFERT